MLLLLDTLINNYIAIMSCFIILIIPTLNKYKFILLIAIDILLNNIPIISLILDLFDADIDKEFKMMSNNSMAFSNAKFSDTKKILRQMELDKMILNIMILSVINYIGFSIGF